MKKKLMIVILCLGSSFFQNSASAFCDLEAKKVGVVAGGVLVGGLLGGPFGAVIGAAIGGWIDGGVAKCKTEKVALTQPTMKPSVTIVQPKIKQPEDFYPFDDKGEVHVYFATGSNILDDSYHNILVQASDFLKNNPEYDLHIIGSADPTGSQDGYDNLALSQRRAETVRNYLNLDEGINAQRLFIKGVGAISASSSKEYPKLRVAKLKLIKKDQETDL